MKTINIAGSIKEEKTEFLQVGRGRKRDHNGRYIKEHGMIKSQLYAIWAHIKNRCLNPNDKGYKNYGGRGIKICAQWIESFTAFADWANKNGYEKGLEIDRINNNGNYEPLNCRFVKNIVNQRNRRNVKPTQTTVELIRILRNGGEKQKDIASRFDISQSHVSRICSDKKWKSND